MDDAFFFDPEIELVPRGWMTFGRQTDGAVHRRGHRRNEEMALHLRGDDLERRETFDRLAPPAAHRPRRCIRKGELRWIKPEKCAQVALDLALVLLVERPADERDLDASRGDEGAVLQQQARLQHET